MIDLNAQGIMKKYSSFHTKGRLFPEAPDALRHDFEKDYYRIITSNSFRRLQYKTQVVMNSEGDHFRNRMTHSLEMGHIADIIAKHLGLSRQLATNISLCHDIGHPPFGHAGENALNLCMQDHGGFSHNAHAVKLLTLLDSKFLRFPGLNLCWETIEGVVKHNGPINISNTDQYIVHYNQQWDLLLSQQPSLEAQISNLADDITYNCHDIEDGIRMNCFVVEDLSTIPLLQTIIYDLSSMVTNEYAMINLVVEKLKSILIQDLLSNIEINISAHNIASVDDIRSHTGSLVQFSQHIQHNLAVLKEFLFNKFYNNPVIITSNQKCQHIIRQLFDLYLNHPKYLPHDWQARVTTNNKLINVVADYIACMTDRYAIKQFELLYSIQFHTI